MNFLLTGFLALILKVEATALHTADLAVVGHVVGVLLVFLGSRTSVPAAPLNVRFL
jgi:hypothetical protein